MIYSHKEFPEVINMWQFEVFLIQNNIERNSLAGWERRARKENEVDDETFDTNTQTSLHDRNLKFEF